MTHLYNCRHDGDQFRITKWDTDMNVEASYLLTAHECECPAAARDTCRHRQMLPKFIARGAVGTEWFYDHDRGGWVSMALPGAEPGGHREQASVVVDPYLEGIMNREPIRICDEDDIEIFEPNASYHDDKPIQAGEHAKDVTPTSIDRKGR